MIRPFRQALARRRARARMPDDVLAEVQALRAEVAALRRSQRRQVARRVRAVEARSQIDLERRRLELDRLPALREQLAGARREADYEAAYDEPEPLVSVRIASFERTQQLMELAIPSVLAQSYDRLEVVVVNDGPNPRTRAAIERLGDPRVRYDETPVRGDYPKDPRSRWRVAGTPAGNRGIELCRGRWIAALDDDDEFTADHVETLLSLARDERAELVWGALVLRDLAAGTERTITCPRPTEPQFRFQAAMYHASLSMFRYEPLAWTLQEAGDKNLSRRMVEAGVRTAGTEAVVGTLNVVWAKDKPTHPWSQPS